MLNVRLPERVEEATNIARVRDCVVSENESLEHAPMDCHVPLAHTQAAVDQFDEQLAWGARRVERQAFLEPAIQRGGETRRARLPHRLTAPCSHRPIFQEWRRSVRPAVIVIVIMLVCMHRAVNMPVRMDMCLVSARRIIVVQHDMVYRCSLFEIKVCRFEATGTETFCKESTATNERKLGLGKVALSKSLSSWR
jgi:hypothetical protein